MGKVKSMNVCEDNSQYTFNGCIRNHGVKRIWESVSLDSDAEEASIRSNYCMNLVVLSELYPSGTRRKH